MIATPRMFDAAPAAASLAAVPIRRDAAQVAREVDGMPRLPRERIPAELLVELLNCQVAVHPGCEGIRISGEALCAAVPDRTGCNWSPSALCVAVEHGASTRALASLRAVVDWARVRYDVE